MKPVCSVNFNDSSKSGGPRRFPWLVLPTKAGRWQIGRKIFGAIPYVGALGIAATQADNVEAKGFYFGSLQTGLENVPVVEWVMLAGGDKCIPSDKDAVRWYKVLSQPVKHIDEARSVIQAVDSPGFFDWIDDLFRPLDFLRGNW